jgi:hypothetical protein
MQSRPLRFGPAFFWLLMPVTWVVFIIGLWNADVHPAGPRLALIGLFGLYATVGTLVNVFRWRQLGRPNRIALVLLGVLTILFGPIGVVCFLLPLLQPLLWL